MTKRYIRPEPTKNDSGMFQSNRPKTDTPDISEISISSLLDDGLITLYREIKNLSALSENGKLLPQDAKDLRDHLKLLFELKDREDQLLRGLTDEELETKAKEVLKPDENV
jgi:hypothetical protein